LWHLPAQFIGDTTQHAEAIFFRDCQPVIEAGRADQLLFFFRDCQPVIEAGRADQLQIL
jgi:hypothetical protein